MIHAINMAIFLQSVIPELDASSTLRVHY
uniref:Uncharacterized protein n=1 Tax=Cupriavidus taiwanensis TaxID=164546 RepID=A0A375HF86_9BURK|nr:protein of unknown function [Cupriavidus taiwanensis]